MADSIREQILQNVKTSLEQILVANGYDNDIRSVERGKLDALDNQTFPCIGIFEGDDSRASESSGNAGFANRMAYLVIEGWIEDPQDQSKAVNSLIADTEKALMVDRQRGGLAHDTNIGDFRIYIGEDYRIGFHLEINIHYQRQSSDPYTQ